MTRVRMAVAGDAAAIERVERECEGAPHWSAMVWAGVLKGSAGRVCFVVEPEGQIVGFVVMACVGDVAEVESVAVAVSARRRGFARVLLKAAVDWARRHGVVQMQLEVRASNEAARSLYAALEFVEQGRRHGYYCEPVEDAVLMSAKVADATAKV